MKKLKAIATGVKNALIESKEIEAKAQERLAICKTCEYYNGTCKYCGCVAAFKVRQDIEKCPLKKW